MFLVNLAGGLAKAINTSLERTKVATGRNVTEVLVGATKRSWFARNPHQDSNVGVRGHAGGSQRIHHDRSMLHAAVFTFFTVRCSTTYSKLCDTHTVTVTTRPDPRERSRGYVPALAYICCFRTKLEH